MPIWARFLITAAIIVADQVTKKIAEKLLTFNQPVEINALLNMTLHYNEGAAFSFLADAGEWKRVLLTGVSLIVSIVIAVWLYRLARNERLMTWSLILVLGGAIGNLIDRALYGRVTDFIQVHYQNWYFPTFNIADSAISVGAALMIWLMLFPGKSEVSA